MLGEINRDLVEALGAGDVTNLALGAVGRAESGDLGDGVVVSAGEVPGLLVGGFGRALHRVWMRQW